MACCPPNSSSHLNEHATVSRRPGCTGLQAVGEGKVEGTKQSRQAQHSRDMKSSWAHVRADVRSRIWALTARVAKATRAASTQQHKLRIPSDGDLDG